MPSVGWQQQLIACACIAVLVFLAFLAVYADNGSNRPIPSRWEVVRADQTESKKKDTPAEPNPSTSPAEAIPVEVFPAPHTAAQREEEQRHEDEKTANDRSLTSATWVIADFTVVLGLIAIIQAALFVWQLRLVRDSIVDAKDVASATKESAKIAKNSLDLSRATVEKQLRPYILIDRCEFIYPDEFPKGKVYIHTVIKNFGQTPCYKGTIKFESFIGLQKPQDFVIPFTKKCETMSSIIIAPGHQHIIHIDRTEEMYGDGQWDAHRHAGHQAYLWGRFDYVDGFGHPHWMTFQLFCPFFKALSFSNAKVGNDAD